MNTVTAMRLPQHLHKMLDTLRFDATEDEFAPEMELDKDAVTDTERFPLWCQMTSKHRNYRIN